MLTRSLGTEGLEVSAIGLGCESLTHTEKAEAIATVHEALDRGVTLLDTADFYDMGQNELFLQEALRGVAREKTCLSVKFGALRGPDGRFLGSDCRPKAVETFLAYSLRRLGTDYIDIYRPARLDPSVPIEDTVGAIADMVKAGYVRHIGLSEVGSATIRRAHAVYPITDVQMEYSLFTRVIENDILTTCRELGIGVTAYGVLSHGLLTGHMTTTSPSLKRGFQAVAPRFKSENLEHNLTLVEALRPIAESKGVTIAQVAIAWVLSRGQDIVALVGAGRRESLDTSLRTLDITLSASDLAQIEHAIPANAVAGERYPVPLMSMLDSERKQDNA